MAGTLRIRRLAACLALLFLVAVPASHSLARTCAASGTEATRLQRQVASNSVMARRHGCDVGNGGFACREVAGRIAQARTALAALPSACKSDLRAVRETASRPKPKRIVRQPVKAEVAATRATTSQATLCVRLSDGYYFPTPNSGFQALPASTENLAAQCRTICDTADMDVFRQPRENGEPADMISLTSGTRYGDLDVAGLYRKAAEARACDMSRIAPAASTSNAAARTLPDPILKQAPTVLATALFQDIGLRGTRTDIPKLPRKVRMVGPAFLPEL
ncbi:hypothetical protein ASG39_09170 [Rhizobium sp. Leaf371]|nr:hypothetical protein ASG39_09170 [Rhizobium sp. Leaf371]